MSSVQRGCQELATSVRAWFISHGISVITSSFDEILPRFQEKTETKKKKKKKFSLLALFKRKKKGRVTPNTSKEDLEKDVDDEIKKDPLGETGITMVNGGDTGNGIPPRAGLRLCSTHL